MLKIYIWAVFGLQKQQGYKLSKLFLKASSFYSSQMNVVCKLSLCVCVCVFCDYVN